MHNLMIKSLTVEVENKKILKDFSIEINSGEIHAIMGPNGTGKSTLSKVIMGDPNYKIINGDILFDGKSIKDLTVDERARLGIFLGMQMPLEIDGVTNADFLRTALNIKQGNSFSLMPFIKKLDETVEHLKMDKSMIHRGINQGFSGGERKKNEILQMYMLEPLMVVLDEIDSGLDVDSLKIVGKNIMEYYKKNKPGLLVITHYQRLLNYIKPDFVHIIIDGKIVKSGDFNLVKEIEKTGYENILKNDTCMVKEK
ncbi:MAG: Fe-S cluster assembly ATPase SufC [Ignavibacteriales bacterium]